MWDRSEMNWNRGASIRVFDATQLSKFATKREKNKEEMREKKTTAAVWRKNGGPEWRACVWQALAFPFCHLFVSPAAGLSNISPLIICLVYSLRFSPPFSSKNNEAHWQLHSACSHTLCCNLYLADVWYCLLPRWIPRKPSVERPDQWKLASHFLCKEEFSLDGHACIYVFMPSCTTPKLRAHIVVLYTLWV